MDTKWQEELSSGGEQNEEEDGDWEPEENSLEGVDSDEELEDEELEDEEEIAEATDIAHNRLSLSLPRKLNDEEKIANATDIAHKTNTGNLNISGNLYWNDKLKEVEELEDATDTIHSRPSFSLEGA